MGSTIYYRGSSGCSGEYIKKTVSVISGQTYTINIGAGGTGGAGTSPGSDGGDSTAFNVTARGGGGGSGNDRGNLVNGNATNYIPAGSIGGAGSKQGGRAATGSNGFCKIEWGTVFKRFDSSGEHTFVCPAGMTEATVIVAGAGGGYGSGFHGGWGECITQKVSVVPENSYSIIVGKGGTTTGSIITGKTGTSGGSSSAFGIMARGGGGGNENRSQANGVSYTYGYGGKPKFSEDDTDSDGYVIIV